MSDYELLTVVMMILGINFSRMTVYRQYLFFAIEHIFLAKLDKNKAKL